MRVDLGNRWNIEFNLFEIRLQPIACEILKHINTLIFYRLDHEDVVVWKILKSRDYSIRIDFNILSLNSPTTFHWNKI